MTISQATPNRTTIPPVRELQLQPANTVESPTLAAVPQTSAPPAPEKINQTPPTTRRTTVDQTTGELIFQVIDDHTGLKLSQSPDQAILRMRAYLRQMDATEQPAAIVPKASAKG